MWRRLVANAERRAEVQLQVFRIPPAKRAAPLELAPHASQGSETLSRRAKRSVRRVGRTIGRVARGGLAGYLRVGPSETSRGK
jgi:hypothetical protein